MNSLLVSNIHGGAGPIERKHLQLPFDGNGSWHVADRFVAGLIFKFSSDGEEFPFFPERAPKRGSGVHFHILADAERPLEHRHLFLDGREIECFGRRINCRFELQILHGIRHDLNGLVALLHSSGFCVENAVGLDELRVRVRKHWVFDLVPASEVFQDFFRVIADGRQLDPLLLESRDGALQLDQLPFAEGSPVRGTEKEKNGAVRSFEAVESLYPPKLSPNRKNGTFVTDPDPDRHQLDGPYVNCIFTRRPLVGHSVSELSGYSSLRLHTVHPPI